jgi:ParB family chromosome partitioning protein
MTRKKKQSSILAAAAQAASDTSTAPAPVTGNRVQQKIQGITRAQQDVSRPTLTVEPDECRIWERHNRFYDRLDDENCRDLIEGFISQGKQTDPAVVRRVNGKGKIKYEIICGARRFWTVNWLRANHYPDYKYLVTIEDLDDEAAFRRSNSENLDRQDISDYERAMEYKGALAWYYDNNQSAMAKRLEKTESWLSRYLSLAEVPIQLVNAYANLHDLKKRHAIDLLKLYNSNDKAAVNRLLKRATELHEQHKRDAIEGKRPMNGAKVLQELKATANTKKGRGGDRGPLMQFEDSGTVHLSVTSKNPKGMTIHIPSGTGVTNEQLVSSFRAALKEHHER